MSFERAHRDNALADDANQELAAGCHILGLDMMQIPIPLPTPRMSVNLAQRQIVKAPHGTTVPASIATDLHSFGGLAGSRHQELNVIVFKCRIGRDERERFQLRHCNEQSVERIAMMIRQLRDPADMAVFDG